MRPVVGGPGWAVGVWAVVTTLTAAVIAWVVVQVSHGMPPDLLVYREGGRAILSGGESLYQFGVGPDHLPFTYTPFAAVTFVPWALMSAPVATFTMALGSVFAFSYATWAWLSLLVAGREVRLWGARRVPLAVLAAVLMPLMMAFEPVRATLGYGQVNMLLCAVVVVDVLLPTHSRWRGVLIGVATGFKLTPGVFLVWLAFTRQWRAFFTGCASCAATVAVGFAVMPRSAWQFWTETMFNSQRVGGLAYSSNQALNGALWRWFGPGGHTGWWVVAVLAVTALWAVAIRRLQRSVLAPNTRLAEMVMATAVWGLLISPVSWSHHWVWVWLLVLTFLLRPSWPAVVVACLWLVAVVSQVIWWFPAGDNQEYVQPVWVKLLTSSYTVLAVLTLLGWVWPLGGKKKYAAWDLNPERTD